MRLVLTPFWEKSTSHSTCWKKPSATDMATRSGSENDPDFAFLRDHSRFQALMQRLSVASAKFRLQCDPGTSIIYVASLLFRGKTRRPDQPEGRTHNDVGTR